jgi:hypothetical protein
MATAPCGAVALRSQAADPGIARKPGGGNLVGVVIIHSNFSNASFPHVGHDAFERRLRGSSDEGQISSRAHAPHWGFLASQIRRPWRIMRRLKSPQAAGGR